MITSDQFEFGGESHSTTLEAYVSVGVGVIILPNVTLVRWALLLTIMYEASSRVICLCGPAKSCQMYQNSGKCFDAYFKE